MNFKGSVVDGPHAWLSRLVGEWHCTTKLWLEPGILHEEVPISGTMRLAQDGMILQHTCTSACMGKPQSGMALHGFSWGEDRWTTSWIDSFHNGTRIMLSEGAPGTDKSHLNVLGHYPAAPDPAWGWRTTLELKSGDRLVITHCNRTPQGEEAKAVEIDYRRES